MEQEREKEENNNKKNMEDLVISMGGKFVTTAGGREEGFTTRISQGEGGNSVKKTSKIKKIGTPRKKKNASNLEGKNFCC